MIVAGTFYQEFLIQSDIDLVTARKAIKAVAAELGFGAVDQTRLITAASELGRNMLRFAGGGAVHLEVVDDGQREGVRLVFEDQGPGIPDIERAMTDGYTSAGGLGLGLGGSRRLVHDFEIVSQVGVGTRVTIALWKR